MIFIEERIGDFICHNCRDDIKRIIYVEINNIKFEFCSKCSDEIRLKFGKALGISGRSRSRDRKRKPRCGGNIEKWEDVT